jgi:hypothetical protein
VIKNCTLEGSRLVVDFPKGASLESDGHGARRLSPL